MEPNNTAPPDEAQSASAEAEPNDKEVEMKGLLVQILLLGIPLVIEALWQWARKRRQTAQP